MRKRHYTTRTATAGLRFKPWADDTQDMVWLRHSILLLILVLVGLIVFCAFFKGSSREVLFTREGYDTAEVRTFLGLPRAPVVEESEDFWVEEYRAELGPKLRILVRVIWWERIETEREQYYNGLHRLTVSNESGQILLHLTNLDSLVQGPPDDPTVRLEDLNFDGFRDLLICTSCGSGGQYYEAWLYSPDGGLFVSNKELGLLPNPTINTENKTFTVGGRTYPGHAWTTYGWKDNMPEPLEKGSVGPGSKDYDGEWIEKVERFEDGQWRVVCEQPWEADRN